MDYFDQDDIENGFDTNFSVDRLIVNEMFDGLFISTDLEETISERIHAITEFQELYYSVYNNKKGILKKFVREDLNLLIKKFCEINSDIKVFEIVIYLMLNIHDRIVKYLDDNNKKSLKKELENYVTE